MADQTAVVVGGGIMGVCTAWALVKQGMGHITIIDSHKLPRAVGGSSVDGGRSIRYAYGKDKGYMIMVSDAYDAWNELFADLGENFYSQTGHMAILTSSSSGQAPEESKNMESYKSMTEYKDFLGIEVEYYTKEQISEKYPKIQTDDIIFGVYTPNAGILHAGDIVSKTIEWLKKCSNVTFLEGANYEVVSIQAKGNGEGPSGNSHPNGEGPSENSHPNTKSHHKCFLKSGQVISGDNLVVAVNRYTPNIVPEVKEQGELYSSKQEMTYLGVPAEEEEYWKTLPIFTEDFQEGGGYYFMPYQGGTGQYGVKVSRRNPLSVSNDTEDYEEVEALNQEHADWFNSRFTSKTGNPLKKSYVKICYYDYLKGEEFQMHPLDKSGTAFAYYGFSGHGFKFGSLIGKASASVITGKKTFKATQNWLAGKTLLKFKDVQ